MTLYMISSSAFPIPRVFEVSTISFRHYTTRAKSTTYTATLAVSTFNVAQAVGSGIRLYDGPDIKLFSLVGWGAELLVCCLATTWFHLVVFFGSGFRHQGSLTESAGPRFRFIMVVFMIYLFVLYDYLEIHHEDRTTKCCEPLQKRRL